MVYLSAPSALCLTLGEGSRTRGAKIRTTLAFIKIGMAPGWATKAASVAHPHSLVSSSGLCS